jgi:hypothetical protein
LESLFENKYKNLNGDFLKYINEIIYFNNEFGDLATFYSFGMERKTEPERINKLLEDIYRDKIKNIKFAVLYGSKKGFSDIDLFIVGNIEDMNNDWLDVRNYSKEEFEKKLNLLDIEITDPLFSGEIVLGDKLYFEKSKQKVLSQPITEDAIKYNFCRSDEQLNLALKFDKSDINRNNGLLYSATYIRNALALKKGKKLLTKERLISDSQGEKFIELEGGKT